MDQQSTDTLARSEHAVIEMAIDIVRFVRTFRGLLGKLEPSEATRYGPRAMFLANRVEDHLASIGLSFAPIKEGQPYDPGLPVRVLNLEDFGPDQALSIAQVLEPVVIGPRGVCREGVVLVEKAENP